MFTLETHLFIFIPLLHFFIFFQSEAHPKLSETFGFSMFCLFITCYLVRPRCPTARRRWVLRQAYEVAATAGGLMVQLQGGSIGGG